MSHPEQRPVEAEPLLLALFALHLALSAFPLHNKRRGSLNSQHDSGSRKLLQRIAKCLCRSQTERRCQACLMWCS